MAGGSPVPAARGFGLLGILNLAPDSFFDGGKYNTIDLALEKAANLLADGADVIDVGAESTRPGASRISQAEEGRRLFPVLNSIRSLFPDVVISVDTRNSETARAALAGGCQIINDVSACRHDPGLLDVLAQYRPGYVLMHAKGTPDTMQIKPEYENVVDEVRVFFDVWLRRLTAAGLPENRIALDPGIGFGKTRAHNLQLLKAMDKFREFGRPLLAGVSMKAFLARFCGGLKDRGEATALVSTLLYSKGVAWHRVHEPGRVGSALSLGQAIL